MEFDYSTYISLASIAGIFVGFAALLKASDAIDSPALIKGTITIGMLTLVGALMPVLLTAYGIEPQLMWRLSSAIFLMLIWFSLWHPTTRQFRVIQFKMNRKAALFFWIFIEIPIQLSLLLTILGVFPSAHNAFFLTSILLNLIQAGFLLVQFVHAARK